MKARRRTLTTAFLLLTLAPCSIQACSCVMVGNGCGQWLPVTEGAVFLGTVTAKVDLTEPKDPDMPGRVGYAVHFSVTETFHAGSGVGGEIVVSTGSAFGDCGYPFVVGSSYLVYASRYEGRLGTGTCSGTKPENTVGGLLKQLRAIRDNGHGFELFGTAVMLDVRGATSDETNWKALSEMSVRIVGSRGNVLLAKTNDRGAYTVERLTPDTYQIGLDLPAGLSVAGSPPQPLKIEASQKKLAGFGCLVDIVANPDGRISGIVVDATGRALPGFVTLEPTDPKEASAARQRGGLPGDESEDGKFSLTELPPGRYRLIFSPKTSRGLNLQRKFYWPASSVANEEAIKISLGQHIDNVRFEVPVSVPDK